MVRDKYDEYKKIGTLSAIQGGSFTHEVHKVEKKDVGIFYSKVTGNSAVAAIEATAGQIYNLLMPYQPQTILAEHKGKTFLLSQELPGYMSLSKLVHMNKHHVKESINSGDYQGLGSVLTASYFLNEVDSKYGNLGVAKVDGVSRIIKIDGDWSLAALRDPTMFGPDPITKTDCKITAAGLNKIPLLSDYRTYNLLDRFQSGAANPIYMLPEKNSPFRMIDSKLPNDPKFRAEVNEMILKTLLIPQALIQEIASRNTDKENIYELITKEILSRQQQMLAAALQNDSFKLYMQSPAAAACLTSTAAEMKQFQAEKLTSQHSITTLVEQNFKNVQMEFAKIAQVELELNSINKNVEKLNKELKDMELKPREASQTLKSIEAALNKAANLAGSIGKVDIKEAFIGREKKVIEEQKILESKLPLIIPKVQLMEAEKELQKSVHAGDYASAAKHANIAAKKALEVANLNLKKGNIDEKKETKGYKVLSEHYVNLAKTYEQKQQPSSGFKKT